MSWGGKMKNNKIWAIMALLFSAIQSQAGTATGNFQSIANLTPTCVVRTWIDINFGSITNGSTSYLSNEPFQITCTKGTTYDVTVSGGNGTVDNRYMLGQLKGDKLYYNLYTTTSYTTVYGDGTAGTVKISGTGDGTTKLSILQAKMQSGQWVTPDNYQDNITLTLTY